MKVWERVAGVYKNLTKANLSLKICILMNKIQYIQYIYIYIICRYTDLPMNVIARLPHTRSGDSQGQETFWAQAKPATMT